MQNNTICLFDNIKRHPSVIQISSKPCLLQLKENTQLYTVFNHTSKSFLIHFPNKLISCLFLFSQPLPSVLLSVTVCLILPFSCLLFVFYQHHHFVYDSLPSPLSNNILPPKPHDTLASNVYVSSNVIDTHNIQPYTHLTLEC